MTKLFNLIFLVVIWGGQAFAGVADPLRYLPVQDAGRLKPYDTLARESLELIHGKLKYKGKDAIEVVTTWMVIPEQWDEMELVEVRHKGLRDALKLDGEKIHYSVIELMSNSRLPLVLQEMRSRRETGEKLNPYFQAVQRLENQIGLYQAFKLGKALRVVPNRETDTWLDVSELQEPHHGRFREVASAFVQSIAAATGGEGEKPSAEKQKAAEEALAKAVAAFVDGARQEAPDKYASSTAIKAEVHYNAFHPIKWSWVCYLLSGVGFIAFLVNRRDRWRMFGWWFFGIGMALHTYGMALRIYLAGRPPVSNMYETVIWVPFGALLFAALIYRSQRNLLIMIAANVIAVLCLILTDLAPTVLDDSIQPLEPVLRSTFWLTTHVLIITISYAAYFLAFALGDWVLFCYLKDEKKYAVTINQSVQAIYRAIQIGCVLLAAGIILGGVWADYSWGRFWGWDPKETWALIAFLGYVALLHARLTGLVRAFGTAAGAVVAFSLVVMAWYGVNFVLGAGLHSYGFGAGGVEYVSAFVFAHILFVGFAIAVRRSRLKAMNG
jgi:cytochrome c-type biogenesis protein CcsB